MNSPSASLFEIEQAVAQDAEAVQRFAHERLDGPQVFADDDHLMAHAFERQDADQIFVVLADIGAGGGLGALRNPEEAEESHHVIDAQGAAVPAVLADGFGEQAVSVFAMLFRAGRRKAPILALRGEVVGRRSDAASGGEERALGPQVGAEAVGGQGQIVIQPDGQAPLARVGLGGGELQIELPLQVAIKQNQPPVFFAKGLRFRGESGSW